MEKKITLGQVFSFFINKLIGPAILSERPFPHIPTVRSKKRTPVHNKKPPFLLPQRPKRPSRKSLMKKAKMLFLDLNPNPYSPIYSYLSTLEGSVIMASSVESADLFLEKKPVDLILLNMGKSHKTALAFLLNLQQKKNAYQPLILIIMPPGHLNDVVALLEAGADDFIFYTHPALLEARIAACLERVKHAQIEQQFRKKLISSNLHLDTAIESIEDGFAIFDENDHLVKCNTQFRKLYPRLFKKKGAPSPITYHSFLTQNLKRGIFKPDPRKHETEQHWIRTRLKQHAYSRLSLVERLPGNQWIEIKEYRTPEGGTVALHKNITAQKLEHERLAHMALFDSLTNLANRENFERTLNLMINQAKGKNQSIAILYLDVDSFKDINDTLGHIMGDTVLVKLSSLLKQLIRNTDNIARLGGDEFAILLANDPTIQSATKISKRILSAVKRLRTKENLPDSLTLSIGIAFCPQDALEANELINAADQAMYQAKRQGKATYYFYGSLENANKRIINQPVKKNISPGFEQ